MDQQVVYVLTITVITMAGAVPAYKLVSPSLKWLMEQADKIRHFEEQNAPPGDDLFFQETLENQDEGGDKS